MNPVYAQSYLFIGILTVAAIMMGVLPLVLARFIAPKKPGFSKQSAYECGLESQGNPWVQMKVHYYLYALLFVIFDVEVIFLYPWALVWKGLGLVAFVEMAVFVAILAAGLAYAWKKGVLEWQ
jgi:NADH:ubiquinone oxidoreductase subunit 3 (subunit A)